MEKGIPVLCETPPGKNVAELNELWTLSQKYNGRVQIVEQYFLQPYYASILDIIKQGYLGTMQLAYSENFSVLNTKIVSFREKNSGQK